MAAAGRFNARANFEREISTGGVDKYGNPAGAAWVETFGAWADLRETPGREMIAAGRLEAPTTGTLRVRANVQTWTITAADRVRVRRRGAPVPVLWSIVGPGVDIDGRGRVLEFPVERGGATE